MEVTERKVILHIDDDQSIRSLIAKYLFSENFDYYEVSSIESGLELIEKVKPDLILLDLRMPEEDGFVFLKIRRDNIRLKNIPVIVLSADNISSSVRLAISLGANDFIIKPFKITSVLRKIRKSLKINDFHKLVFDINQRPEATIMFTGKVTMINETGIKIFSPVKIKEKSVLKIKSKLLSKIDENKIVFKTSGRGIFSNKKEFFSHVNFIGVSREILIKVKRLLLEVQNK